MLSGENTILLWLRDIDNTWQNELSGSKGPETISGTMLDLSNTGLERYKGKISIYDPWQDRWSEVVVENMKVLLPDFKRSIVVRIKKQ
jgi:hypothetical protein